LLTALCQLECKSNDRIKLKYPPTDEEITMWYIYTIDYYSVIKSMIHVKTWMNFENIC
jgi:hypothetical protein